MASKLAGTDAFLSPKYSHTTGDAGLLAEFLHALASGYRQYIVAKNSSYNVRNVLGINLCQIKALKMEGS